MFVVEDKEVNDIIAEPTDNHRHENIITNIFTRRLFSPNISINRFLPYIFPLSCIFHRVLSMKPKIRRLYLLLRGKIPTPSKRESWLGH